MIAGTVALSISTPALPAFAGLLTQLDLSSQVMIAGMLFLFAWYVLRAARIGSSIAAISATAVQIAISVFIIAAIAVGLGWVNPRPSVLFSDAQVAFRWTVNVGVEFIADLFRRAVKVVR